MRAAALSKCKLRTPYLNLRGMTVGARPVEGMAGMLERSYALARLNLSHNAIGAIEMATLSHSWSNCE
eukprot:3252395-Rhodomonas_salina.1